MEDGFGMKVTRINPTQKAFPFLILAFDVFRNGRKYQNWRWQPEGCGLPRGSHFEDKGKVTMSLNVMEAFKKSLQTSKLRIEKLNPERTRVFFLGFSPEWYMGLGGSQCDMDRQPETNYTMLEPEPVYNQIISPVIKEMDYGDRKVQFLNITHLTLFRYDGHPSRHREPGIPVDAPQDCRYWCLPGIPDME